MNTKTNFIHGALRILLALVFSLSLIGIFPSGVSAGGALMVNSNGDGGDASPGDGYCDTGTGVCTLRAALQEANAHLGAETINFSTDMTITLGSSLPVIYENLTIDGTGHSVSISGNNLYRVLWVGESIEVILEHLSIVNGNVTGIPGGGGGILNYGTLSVRNCTFSGNQAVKGGAIYSDTGTLQVSDSTFDGNNVTENGGAIGINDGSLTVANSTFVGNKSSIDGGAIWGKQIVGTNTMSVTNSTFAYNSTGSYGGGIENYQGTLTVTNSTFSDNDADYGGGIDDYGTLHLKNTILANSLTGGDCWSFSGPASEANNLIEDNNGCGTPVSSADPNLGPFANNGGPTQTYALLPGSPAINAGDDATCAAAPVSNKDQRGVTRPFGAHCDIGSYELNKGSLTPRSVGAYDGWILESGEFTNVGGTLNTAATTFNLGDETGDRQYRAILSFNTGALPDTAIITKVTLHIRKAGWLGTNPFSILGGLKVDIRKPFFGTSPGLLISDFQAAPGKSAVGTFSTTPKDSWYSATIGLVGYPFINKTGTTQFRLRFYTGDNDDGNPDYLKFCSGNNATVTNRPILIIEYYVP